MAKKNIPKKKKGKKSKSSKKEAKKKAIALKKKKQYITSGLTAAVVLVVLLATGMLYANSVEVNENSPAHVRFFDRINKALFPIGKELAAVVNDEEITMDELDSRYNSLSPNEMLTTDKIDVLNNMIEQKLLFQEAERRDLSATDDDVEQTLNQVLLKNNLTLREYSNMLEDEGSSIEEAEEYYWKTITISRLLNETVYGRIQVTSIEIRDYYLERVKPYSDLTFSESYDLINQTLITEQYYTLFEEFIADLREDADVIIFYEE